MFARAIGSVLSAGVITDTIVHSMAVMLTGLPSALLGVGMLSANTLINVVLTSGSGQVAAVMPIMIPPFRSAGCHPSDLHPEFQLRRRLLQLHPAHLHRPDGHSGRRQRAL